MANGAQYDTILSATTAGTAAAFGIQALKLIVINDGGSNIYVDFTTTSGCTTGAHQMKSGESISLTSKSHSYYDGLSVTCTSGGTATVRVLALR